MVKQDNKSVSYSPGGAGSHLYSQAEANKSLSSRPAKSIELQDFQSYKESLSRKMPNQTKPKQNKTKYIIQSKRMEL